MQIVCLSGFVSVAGCMEYVQSAGPDHCGSIEGKEAWTKTSNPHVISCSTTIAGNVVVGPGTTILFTQGAQLVVTGELRIEGTKEQPVLLEGKDGASFPGLIVKGNGGDTKLSHVTINGGGFAENAIMGGLTIDSGPVQLNNVQILDSFECGMVLTEMGRLHVDSSDITIKRSAEYPICSHVQAAFTLDESMMTLGENGQQGFQLFGENLAGSNRWSVQSWPYVVSETFRIQSGSLTLTPGVQVQVDRYHSIVVGDDSEEADGRLITMGEPENLVQISGVDDKVGSWGGILVESSAGARRVSFTHTRIENGGSLNGFPIGMLTATENVEIVAQHLTLEGSESLGFAFGIGSSWSDDSANLTVHQNGQTGQMDANGVGSIPETTTLSENTLNRVSVISSDLSESSLWRDYGSSYGLVEGLATGNAGTESVGLTVQGGVVLEFAAEKELELGETGTASVLFDGTVESPIVLKGLDSEEDGFWGGIQFSGGLSSASMKHVQVFDGGLVGGASLRLDGGTLDVQSVRVEGSLGAGVRVRSGRFSDESLGLTVSGNASAVMTTLANAETLPIVESAYTGNTNDVITFSEDRVIKDMTLSPLGIPYVAGNGLYIVGSEEASTTLTIDSGTTLLFGVEKSLSVAIDGALVAVGTPEALISFAPLDSEEPGAWQGIRFGGQTNGSSTLEYVDVGYAGFSRAAIEVTRGDPTIRLSTIHHSLCYGIYVQIGSVGAVVEDITYFENTCGDFTNTFP